MSKGYAAMTPPDNKRPVLFFDGVCNLCNHAVQFIIRHDKQGKVKFATLQSAAGERAKQAVSQKLGHVPDSLILFDKGNYYAQSAAALKVTAYLDGGWPILKVLMVIPSFIRNPVYRFIAARRYKWFGKQDSCMMPTPDLQRRFIND
jgi:predicted DCC family thiol-disulfide oxidoreductase YuxK